MNKFFSCILALLGLNAFSACSNTLYDNVSVSDFAALLTHPDVQLLDVRTASEYTEGHLEGARNLDVHDSMFVEKALQLLDAEKPVLVYCRSGRRSADAASRLAANGFSVTNLTGGIMAWEQAHMTVTTSTAEVDVFRTPGGKVVRLHAFMHASMRIDFDGTEIEIDPVGQMGDRSTDYASLPEARYIFITHEHHDHFDPKAISLLTADDTQVITNARCGEMLGYGTVMANGERLELSELIAVEAVPAYNNTEGHTQFHPQGRDNGYILTLDGLRIYIAGDTEDIPEMSAIKDIDIAFLPCNQPYTMTPEQLVRAARMVRPHVLFPYHYSQTDVTPLPTLLKDDQIEVRIRHYE